MGLARRVRAGAAGGGIRKVVKIVLLAHDMPDPHAVSGAYATAEVWSDAHGTAVAKVASQADPTAADAAAMLESALSASAPWGSPWTVRAGNGNTMSTVSGASDFVIRARRGPSMWRLLGFTEDARGAAGTPIVASVPPDMRPRPYFLHVGQEFGRSGQGAVSPSASIGVDGCMAVCGSLVASATDHESYVRYSPPLGRLSRVCVQATDADGSLVDFSGREHVLVLRVEHE